MIFQLDIIPWPQVELDTMWSPIAGGRGQQELHEEGDQAGKALTVLPSEWAGKLGVFNREANLIAALRCKNQKGW